VLRQAQLPARRKKSPPEASAGHSISLCMAWMQGDAYCLRGLTDI